MPANILSYLDVCGHYCFLPVALLVGANVVFLIKIRTLLIEVGK